MVAENKSITPNKTKQTGLIGDALVLIPGVPFSATQLSVITTTMQACKTQFVLSLF